MERYKVALLATAIICILVIAVAALVFGEHLFPPYTPLPEHSARFLNYLSCSHAMCARGCNSPEVIDIWLDGEKGGCNDVCNDMGSGHLCGKDYALEFVFERGVTYHSDYRIWVDIPWVVECNRMDTDVKKYKDWFKTIHGDVPHFWCNGYVIGGTPGYPDTIVLGGHEFKTGCTGKCGVCEGMLRSSGSCAPGQKDGQSYDSWYNTGHLWIGPNIIDQCKPFETAGYYATCTFEEGQTVYIWAEPDIRDSVYCPEVIICSTP